MKKKLLICILISTILLSGCSTTSSDQLLSFQDIRSAIRFDIYQDLTESTFFSNDLAVISDEDNIGGDTELSAGATLLINSSDQKVIYADHVYDKLYPASLTKLFTALVVFKYGELTDSVTVGYNAANIPVVGAKRCGFSEGDVISMETLLNCLLIYSGNDAAIAIAEHMYGSEADFVKKMNEEARLVGAIHSNFTNSSGLHDDDQYTTAYDIYLAFHELLRNDSFRSIIENSSYTANYIDKDGNTKTKTFQTTNEYLTGQSEGIEGLQIIGGKTGTTNKAGNCLILLSKNSEDQEFISLILKANGSEQLYSEMTHLLSYTTMVVTFTQ